jgi:hypothetical protein
MGVIQGVPIHTSRVNGGDVAMEPDHLQCIVIPQCPCLVHVYGYTPGEDELVASDASFTAELTVLGCIGSDARRRVLVPTQELLPECR